MCSDHFYIFTCLLGFTWPKFYLFVNFNILKPDLKANIKWCSLQPSYAIITLDNTDCDFSLANGHSAYVCLIHTVLNSGEITDYSLINWSMDSGKYEYKNLKYLLHQ